MIASSTQQANTPHSRTALSPRPCQHAPPVAPYIIALFLVALYAGVASKLNHIDDTDETYGYWEVVHYLLYGHGMQTWEYAPQFAIRTYAFVGPLYLVGVALHYANVPKLAVFYTLRMVLGLCTALAQSQYLAAIQSCYPENPLYMRFTLLFMLLAPGVFFSATSFLPSAVAASLLMLCLARWLQGRFELSIFWGCVAVLMTGWPFVGVLLLPLGLHMLASRFAQRGLGGVVRLTLTGSAVLVLVAGVAGAVDCFMYQKWTSPTINILLYNAAGNGDTLYGTEPASYYVRNLVLNLGAAWPLAIAAPLLLVRQALLGTQQEKQEEEEKKEASRRRLTLLASACLWLVVLFTRPHKEERFLYPVYPLLAFVAAQSLVTLVDMVGGLASRVCGEVDVPIATLLYGSGPGSFDGNDGNGRNKTPGEGGVKLDEVQQKVKVLGVGALVKHACLALSIVVNVSLGCSRLMSNVNHYSGYMQAWEELGASLAREQQGSTTTVVRRVCTGGEWYFFPSHFFLPNHARLEFVSDYFHGQLPQHFSGPAWQGGTWATPRQPFNDLNREEKSRYVQLADCDYVVALINTDVDQAQHGPMVASMSLATAASAAEPGEGNSFSFVLEKAVLDPVRSSSSLARAYHIPLLSKKRNVYNKYSVFSRRRTLAANSGDLEREPLAP